MLSKRAIVVSADKHFAKRLAAGLLAAGTTVETVASLEDLPAGTLRAELVVIHLAPDALGKIEAVPPRLAAGTVLVGVIPTPSLELTVELLKNPAVAAVLVAATYEPSQLSAIASRLLYGDVFGLEKIVPWGVKVYSLLVGDYQEKSVAISTVAEFADAMGVRRKYREAVEQVLDELLMNALYDAPVDAEGKQMFADVPTKTRISLRMEQKAVVQYACDGAVFALSVRDSFGTLSRDTVVRFLDKCLHAEQQIDRKAGGAGLGLYIIANAASAFRFSLYPGVATEVTCTFDLGAPKVQLDEIGFFPERIDAAGRLVGGVSRLVPRAAPAAPAASRGLVALLVGAIALMLGLIAVVAWPRLRARPKTTLAVTTTPPGATIEVDGIARGTSPLTVAELDVGQKVQVAAHLDGYQPAVELVLPQKEETRVALPLSPLPATLVVTSVPPGAAVKLDGKDRGFTPLTATDLQARSEHTVELSRPGHQKASRTLTAPDPGGSREVEVTLPLDADVAVVRLVSQPPGADVYQNAEIIGGIKTPAEHLVRAGRSYSFTIKLPGYKPEIRNVTARRGVAIDPVVVKLVPGGTLTVTTNLPEARLSVPGAPASCQNRASPLECNLADGNYKVQLTAPKLYLAETLEVAVRGADVTRKAEVGWVQVAAADLSLAIPGAPAGIKRAAFLEGEAKIGVVPVKGAAVIKTVKVEAGKTTTVDARP